jgi:hypothetical protein
MILQADNASLELIKPVKTENLLKIPLHLFIPTWFSTSCLRLVHDVIGHKKRRLELKTNQQNKSTFPAQGVKPGLHYQSFCDHSRNFASVNSKFWRICRKCLRKLTECYKGWFTLSNCFCDHSRNFASVNSKFWRICKKCLKELAQYLTLNLKLINNSWVN